MGLTAESWIKLVSVIEQCREISPSQSTYDLSFDNFCEVDNGRKKITLRFCYYKDIPVILDKSLFGCSRAKRKGDLWFVIIHLRDFGSKYFPQVLEHEIGHAKRRVKTLKFEIKVAAGLWRLKGVRRGLVNKEELFADSYAAEALGVPLVVEWLHSLRVEVEKDLSTHLQMCYTTHREVTGLTLKRRVCNTKALELSLLEIDLRIQALLSSTANKLPDSLVSE